MRRQPDLVSLGNGAGFLQRLDQQASSLRLAAENPDRCASDGAYTAQCRDEQKLDPHLGHDVGRDLHRYPGSSSEGVSQALDAFASGAVQLPEGEIRLSSAVLD